MPLAFTKNEGQWNERVLFKANTGGATMWYTDEGVYYQFTRPLLEDETKDKGGSVERFERKPQKSESFVIKASFIGANPNPTVVGKDLFEHKFNYFLGNDPAKWQTSVPNFKVVVYKDLYPGIDLKYYGNGRRMKYDFIVSPGAGLSQIEVRYEGVKSLSVDQAGELVVETEWGTVTEHKPFVYQLEGEMLLLLQGEYVIISDKSFGFRLTQKYNPSLPLVIDPELTYGTFLGGESDDRGEGIAVDVAGNVYITGHTKSADFPILNAFDSTNQTSCAFLTKVSASASSLIYSTYLGSGYMGGGVTWAYAIAVDGEGYAYVTGNTGDNNFPLVNAADSIPDNGEMIHGEGFVTKLSPEGNSLIYSTYLGGNQGETGRSIAVDNSGSAYVTGETRSNNFPIVNAFDSSFSAPGTVPYEYDGFVTKFSPLGNIIYSTYLGGGNHDWGKGIAVDSGGHAYVTGRTYAVNFPTANAYDSTYNDGTDAFVTKFSPSGTTLVYSTYLGGLHGEAGLDIAVDAEGNVCVAGQTSSSNDFPLVNAYDSTYDLGEVFVTRLSVAGDSLIYSTFLGGSSSEVGYGVTVDGMGSAYVTGTTKSTDFPTVNAYDSTYNGDRYDGWVAKFSPSGNVRYSTYLGGGGEDECRGIAVDAVGNAYVTGFTKSRYFPTTVDAYDTSYNGGTNWGDAFVVKFPAFICGDVQVNGQIDLSDPICLAMYYFGKPCEINPWASDVNCDTSVNLGDAIIIANVYFGKPGFELNCCD